MTTEHQPKSDLQQTGETLRRQVERTGESRRALSSLSTAERARVLIAISEVLEEKRHEILSANAEDLREAEKNQLAQPLVKRLKLTEEKLKTLAKGIRGIAEMPDPIGQVVGRLEVSDGLILDQVTTPIGTLLVIFESRPDSLPQIAALSLKSGNGLVLKGGREAARSNACLHQVITEVIERETRGSVSRDVINLVTTRAEIAELLKLDDLIDLVIPRGSNALVKHIQANTKIPVLGHADGVCHVYIDEGASLEKATRVVVDAKINYPAACNAMETVLLHEALVESGEAAALLASLRSEGVTVLGGPRASQLGLVSEEEQLERRAEQGGLSLFHTEYGDLTCACEVVSDLEAAILHCNRHGSGHTESIVTENLERAERFLREVDSACVFHNASTRFADGFRFGLGAEVGISTSKIHARGPVGVKGLLSTKWLLRSGGERGHTVGDFSGRGGAKYTHKALKTP